MVFCDFKPILLMLFSFMIWVFLSYPVSATNHCRFPVIFNFGDSNSDTGGLSAAFGQAPSPNGETFFGKPVGRYSDGRLIIDFIAKAFGLPYLSAYLNSVGSDFSHGANFATAGSTIIPQNTTLFQSGFSPISLDVQSWQFEQFITRSQEARKQGIFKHLLPRKDHFSRSLYTFDIGQNDLTSKLFLNMTVAEVKASVPHILDYFKIIVKNIYEKGRGRHFWVHNTGPLGCLPYVLDRLSVEPHEFDAAGCAIPYNEVAQYFNKKLKEAVKQLREDLPNVTFILVDIYSVKYNLISQAHKHGFEHPLIACCGHGGKYNYNRHVGCGGKITRRGREILIGKSCKNPLVKINWDGVHYTEAANKWVYDQIHNGSFSDPQIPLSLACNNHMGLLV